MYQWTSNRGPNQKWFLSYNGSGFYTIQNVTSKLLLADTNGSTSPGISLQQQYATHDSTQLWSLTATSGGFVIKNKATGLVIDDSGFNPNQVPASSSGLRTEAATRPGTSSRRNRICHLDRSGVTRICLQLLPTNNPALNLWRTTQPKPL